VIFEIREGTAPQIELACVHFVSRSSWVGFLRFTTILTEMSAMSVDPPLNKTPHSRRAKKRSRKTRSNALISVPTKCHLACVPIEIIADILSYTRTPKDILALTRTSKWLFSVLNSPSAAYIWKNARLRCVPQAIPDPLPTFTECSYAAFIFDGGMCHVRHPFYAIKQH
jgi:hypothetical protein